MGLAGCVAAVEAVEAVPGARVVVFDKAPESHAGGNSRASGQALWIARADQRDAVIDYQRRLNSTNPIPEELLTGWASALVELEPWISAKAEAVGAKLVRGMGLPDIETIVEFPELGGGAAISHNATIEPGPSGVWQVFRDHLLRRADEISVHYESRLVDLVQDPDGGAVLGLVLERNGRRTALRAKGGVILACGSYEANPQIHRDYWGAEQMVTLGSPYNEGDAIALLQKAGARLWHMRNFVQTAGNWPAIAVPEKKAAFARSLRIPGGAWLEIGADHRRFYDESADHRLRHFHVETNGRWEDAPHWRSLPVHVIFDDAIRRASPMATSKMGWNTLVEDYQWSSDNRVEIDAGWIVRADSIGALAKLIGRPAEALQAAVADFEAVAAGEKTCPFGRPRETMRPFTSSPFYAIETVPGVVCSTGGAERNIRAEVIGHDGRAIPGLYEAGELGTIFSGLYQNGAFLTEAMISGRAAGREAAARSTVQ